MRPETISVAEARRLALGRAGLLKPEWTGLPRRASGAGQRARAAAHRVIERFGYLQLDTVAIAGARSHAIVLLSRLDGFAPGLGEELLAPGEPLFEYWGHEVSWLPLALYPLFEFRRRAFRHHPWWGDVIGRHREDADRLLARIRDQGPLRSAEMEGEGSSGWWEMKTARRVAVALWSSGDLAIRERRGFQRSFDLAERVIPEALRSRPVPEPEALAALVLLALGSHGFATRATLRATWRLKARQVDAALAALVADRKIRACDLVEAGGRRIRGFIRPEDLDLAGRLGKLRPRPDRGTLLSPFDPVLWDRARVRRLFGFDQVLEIFKPARARVYGYYCLPVLAGDRLVARVDLVADRRRRSLRLIAGHVEDGPGQGGERSAREQAARGALAAYAAALGLDLRAPRSAWR
jgi:hypothetical protein